MFEISRHVHNPGDISFTAKNVATNSLFALLLIILIAFPVQLVNDTLVVHHDEIQHRLRHFREAMAGGVVGTVMHPGSSSFGLIGGMALLAGVIYGFLDPGFGFDQASIAFVVGLAISFLVIVVAWELPHMWWTHTHTERSVALRVFPAVIPIAIVCVLLSRATGLHPGFVFGITAGTVAVAGEASREHEGRSAALGAATLFGVVLLAWLLWWPVSNAAGDASHPSFLLLVLDSVLVGTVIAGLQWMVFGLVPMTFLRGGSLFRYSKILWAFLIGAGAFALLFLVLHPVGGLSDGLSPVVSSLIPFIVLAVGSIAFWAYFRFRPAPDPSTWTDDSETGGDEESAPVPA